MDREEILSNINNDIAENNFETAKKGLEDYLAQNPDDNSTEIQKMLGLCNVNLEKMQEAKENFEKVVAQDKEDATSWFYLGMIYEAGDDLEKSVDAYNKVIGLREDYKDAYKIIATLACSKFLFSYCGNFNIIPYEHW